MGNIGKGKILEDSGGRKIFAFVISAFIIGILVLSGPAIQALVLELSGPTGISVEKGEEISFDFSLKIWNGESLNGNIVIYLNDSNYCEFDINGNNVSGCSGFLIEKIGEQDNYVNYDWCNYGYGFGYGYGYGYDCGSGQTYSNTVYTYNVTIDTNYFDIGSYEIYFKAGNFGRTETSETRNFDIIEPVLVCDVELVELCLDPISCESNFGYWYNNICNPQPEVICDTELVELCLGGDKGPVCSPENLDLCLDEENCDNANGYWYENICNPQPEVICDIEIVGLCLIGDGDNGCNPETLDSCLDQESCESALGYWYDDTCNSEEGEEGNDTETTPIVYSSGGGSSSGGSFSGGCNYNADYDWECSEWSECENNIQTRTCNERNNCGNSYGKPAEIKQCVSGFELLSTQDEFAEFVSEEEPGQNTFSVMTGAIIGIFSSPGIIVIIFFIAGLGILTIIIRIIRSRGVL